MSQPNWLTAPIVEAMHESLIAEFGGSSGIRDKGLLESALARPQNLDSYDDPTVYELAASYAFGIARNHAFVDGNKRTALMAAYTFLGLNGYRLEAPEVEAVAVFQDLAAGELGEREVTVWLERNSKPMPA